MDDRFYSEGTSRNKMNVPSDGAHKPENIMTPGDFSENIKTDTPAKKSVQKKFQVHIADFDTFAEVPEYKPYGEDVQERKPEPKAAAPVKPNPYKAQNEKKFEGTMVFDTKKAKVEEKAKKEAARPSADKQAAKRSVDNSKSSAKTQSKSAAQNKRMPKEKIAKARAQSRYNFIKSALALCVCVIFITIITVTASTVALATINDILVINKSEASPVSVEIPAGSDFDAVFDILVDNGLVRQPLVTKLFLKFRHYDKVTKTDEATGQKYTEKIEYDAGNYFLDVNAGIEANIEEIMVRKNVAKDTVRLTFPEGWTIAKIFRKIESSNVCSADKLYANLEIVAEKYGFIKEIDMVSGRYLKSEGYLFPDTYDFYIGENASSVIKKLFNNFENRWTDQYEAQRKKLGMSMDEIITIASIIQREAKDSTQMKGISSVIHNRLNNAATYPSLDMNSTKDYVVSLKDFNLFSDFYYELYLDSYNTYSNPGLPPGPICSPGKAAIEAALFPADTDYNFFCHSEDGTIYYAVTVAEHQINTNKIIYGG